MKNIASHVAVMRGSKISLFMTAATLIVFLASAAALAQGPVVVIVNINNPVDSLTVQELGKYYNNDALNWPNGKKAVLYDLKVKDEARKKFSRSVLQKEPEAVAMEWANKKITNTAKNPPRTVSSAVLMQNRVAKDPAAVGYLLKSQVTSGQVKIVATVE
jgi:ABC-type phosphate transport system substrate-binding protein